MVVNGSRGDIDSSSSDESSNVFDTKKEENLTHENVQLKSELKIANAKLKELQKVKQDYQVELSKVRQAYQDCQDELDNTRSALDKTYSALDHTKATLGMMKDRSARQDEELKEAKQDYLEKLRRLARPSVPIEQEEEGDVKIKN